MSGRIVSFIALLAVVVALWGSGASDHPVAGAVAARAVSPTPFHLRLPTPVAIATTPPEASATTPPEPNGATPPAATETIPPAASPAPTARLLDLATMTLLPSDIKQPGYGLAGGGSRTLDEEAAFLNGLHNGGAANLAKTHDALTAAGWQQSYSCQLSAPSAQDLNSYAGSIVSTLTKYQGAAGAASGFTLLRDAETAAGYTSASGAPKIGQRSALLRYQGKTSSGKAYQELDVIFQQDDLVAAVDLVDFANQPPSVATISTLAHTVQARITSGRRQPAPSVPGLGLQVLRLGGDGVTSTYDYYQRRGGKLFATYNQSSADLTSSEGFFRSAGVTDIYYVLQTLPPAADNPDAYVTYAVVLDRFETGSQAAAWVQNEPKQLVASPGGYVDVKIVPGAAAIGDSSVTVSYGFPHGQNVIARGFSIYTQVGKTVAIISVDAVPSAPATAVEEIATAQVACLQAGSCPNRAPVPAGLATGGPTSSATPSASPNPNPLPSPAPAASPTDPAAVLASLEARARQQSPVAGPASGDLVQSLDTITFTAAGVNLRDFYAHARFANPTPASSHLWDIGFGFRHSRGKDEQFRLVVDSTGAWFLTERSGGTDSTRGKGTLTGLNTAANGANTLDLVAVGDVAYFAVNGRYVATLDVSSRTVPGDVWIASALYKEDAVAGVKVHVTDFSVWSLAASATPAASTPEATAAATGVATEPATAAPTLPTTPAVHTPTASGPAVRFRLAERVGSGVSGLATLTSAGAKTEVKLVLLGAAAGQVALIQQGTCANLDPDPAFLLRDVDAEGHSQTTINVGLDQLKRGGYAIAIHASVDDLTHPLACSEIPKT